MSRHTINGFGTSVGVYQKATSNASAEITIDFTPTYGGNVRAFGVVMDPCVARRLAKRLKQFADFADPPTKKKVRQS